MSSRNVLTSAFRGLRLYGRLCRGKFLGLCCWVSDDKPISSLDHAATEAPRTSPFSRDGAAASWSADGVVQPGKDSGEHRGVLRALPRDCGSQQRSGLWPEGGDGGAYRALRPD